MSLSVALTGDRVNLQLDLAPDNCPDKQPTRGAPLQPRRLPRNALLRQSCAALNRTIQEQAARIQELERFANAHADDLAGVRGACDERIARAEAAFNTARDQLVETHHQSAAELRSARESHTAELVGLRCAYSEYAAESKRAAYALAGPIPTPSLSESELRREADCRSHALIIAALEDRLRHAADHCFKQRTAILERDQYIHKIRRLLAKSRASPDSGGAPAAPHTPTDAHPASGDACPRGPVLLGNRTAIPGSPGKSSGLPPGLGGPAHLWGQSAGDYDPEDPTYVTRAETELALNAFTTLLQSGDPHFYSLLGVALPAYIQPQDSGPSLDPPNLPDCVSPPRPIKPRPAPDPALTGPPTKRPGPQLRFPNVRPPKLRSYEDQFTYLSLDPALCSELIRNRHATESPDSSDSE